MNESERESHGLNRTRLWRAKAVALAGLILALNAWFSANLFGLEFSSQMGSMESSYMSISRWALSNLGDLTWFPLWFTGQPFHNIYQPGFHLAVALAASTAHITPQHAYHLLTALAFCSGPVALFVLCLVLAGRLDFAFFSGLVFSLISPVCFFSVAHRMDAGGWLMPRRYQIIVQYGEGPHTAAVAMIPLVILFLHAALYRRRPLWIGLTVFALAAVVITNWPGTMGLTMAVLAYCLSRIDGHRRVPWRLLIGMCAAAYLIIAPWIPPSTIAAVFANAQQSDATELGRQQILPAFIVIALLALAHLAFSRRGVDRTFRFFAYFALIAGAVVLGWEWFGWRLMPQAKRFEVEFGLAFAGLAGYLLAQLPAILPRRARWGVVAAVCLIAVPQARFFRHYARRDAVPIDITTSIEYRMAKVFENEFRDERVFAPGNVSLWMNLFTDTPQMAGCCDQGIPSFEHRVAVYTIYTGYNAGSKDAEISLLWLRAYGANAIGTTGPNSTEFHKPFGNWRKFEGVLPVRWREGDNVIYEIPRKSTAPVRVIPKSALVTSPPVNGLDVKALELLVAALEDPRAPSASFRWVNRHEALIDADVPPGDVIFLQIGRSGGWHAEQEGVRLPVGNDSLGMMYVQPAMPGHVHVRFIYDGGTEAKVARLLQGLGLAGVVGLALAGRRL